MASRMIELRLLVHLSVLCWHTVAVATIMCDSLSLQNGELIINEKACGLHSSLGSTCTLKSIPVSLLSFC